MTQTAVTLNVGDTVGIRTVDGAARAVVARIEKKPRKATLYHVVVVGEVGERALHATEIHTAEWADDYRVRAAARRLDQEVDAVYRRLAADQKTAAPPHESALSQLFRTPESDFPGFGWPPGSFRKSAGVTIEGLSAAAVQRVCAEADRTKELEREVKRLRALLAHVIAANGLNVNEVLPLHETWLKTTTWYSPT